MSRTRRLRAECQGCFKWMALETLSEVFVEPSAPAHITWWWGRFCPACATGVSDTLATEGWVARVWYKAP